MIAFERLKFQPVNSDDEFEFSCSKCGECCRNIKEAVMVESLDLFRIARYMKLTTAEAMEAYTVPAFLSRGFPILLMKTKPHMDACVFLKNGKCSIHSIKPRTCHLYPLSVGPDDKNKSEFQSFIVSQRPHHFTGQRHRVKNWMDAYFKPEDRAFLLTEYEMAAEAGRLVRQIDAEHDDSIISAMLIFRYCMFDIAQEFQPQYEQNVACLIDKLKDRQRKAGVLMDNKLPVEEQIAIAILDLKEESEEKMIPIKLEALMKLRSIIYQYMNRGFLKNLVLTICEKKIAFIHQARTKKDIDELLAFPKVRFNGREVIPVGKYHIPEEELLVWSMTSLEAPLNDYALKRYEKLFREVLPEQADMLNL